MKKIAFAIDSNTAGGAERVIVTLANYMAQKGHETYLVNSDSESNFYEVDDRVVVKKMHLDTTPSCGLLRFIKKYRYMKRFMNSHKLDVVVTFLFNMEAPTILAGLSTGTRVVTSVRNAPWVYPSRQKAFRRFFYPKIAGVVFQSKMVKGYKDFRKITNSAVIMNPLSDKISNYHDPVPYNQRRKIIINVARLERQKNQALLIKAFSDISKKFPQYDLYIFGEGSLRGELERMIDELNLNERVFLKGETPNATINNRDAALFVLSSNFEGFPNALAESMSLGIPSLSTDFDTGVASELIQDGINGWLTPMNDFECMKNKIAMILSLPGETIDSVALESAKVYYKLCAEKICKEWENFILP